MKTKEDKYEETIKAYKRLGKKYIKDTERFTPPEFFDFVKLLPKGGKVLEAGCSGGRDSNKFVQKGFRVIGIDLVDIFLKEARKNVPNAKFIKMDFRKLKFPQNYFDAIWATAVLLHIKKKDILKTLKGFYRVLKPGGKLHIRVKRGKGIIYEKDILSGGERRLFVYFLKDELERFVEKVGFKIIISRIFPDNAGRKDVKWVSLWAEKRACEVKKKSA